MRIDLLTRFLGIESIWIKDLRKCSVKRGSESSGWEEHLARPTVQGLSKGLSSVCEQLAVTYGDKLGRINLQILDKSNKSVEQIQQRNGLLGGSEDAWRKLSANHLSGGDVDLISG